MYPVQRVLCACHEVIRYGSVFVFHKSHDKCIVVNVAAVLRLRVLLLQSVLYRHSQTQKCSSITAPLFTLLRSHHFGLSPETAVFSCASLPSPVDCCSPLSSQSFRSADAIASACDDCALHQCPFQYLRSRTRTTALRPRDRGCCCAPLNPDPMNAIVTSRCYRQFRCGLARRARCPNDCLATFRTSTRHRVNSQRPILACIWVGFGRFRLINANANHGYGVRLQNGEYYAIEFIERKRETEKKQTKRKGRRKNKTKQCAC